MTNSNSDSVRVLLVIESSGGGSARHVVDLAAGLIRAGHHVEIAYSPLRADAWFVKELEALPTLVIHAIDMQRNPGPHDIKAALALRKLLAQRGPFDIVHGHSAKAGALARLVAMGNPALKIYTPHAFITLDPNLSWLKRLVYTVAERFLGVLADGIICVSHEEQEHARQLGIDERLLFVVENGLSPLAAGDRRAAREQLGLKPADICIGFVGRLSGQKPVSRLLWAFHLLHLQYPHLVLVIIGSGPDFEATQLLARSLNISERVILTGPADGAFLMAGFDIFALPSSYEAFPYVYLEALARSLPIVTTDVGGSSAVVDEAVNGYVVPQKSLDKLVGRIAALAEDAGLRAEMSRQSLRRSARFSVDRMVDQTIAIYRELLQGKATAKPDQ